MKRLAALALAALALAGCTVAPAPERGLSEEEKDIIRQHQTEGLWAATGLYADQRPVSPPVTVVSLDDWAAAYVKCMNNAGFYRYDVAEGGGISVERTSGERSDLERLTVYLCTMSFELEGQFDSRYSAAQIEYLYDYYRDELVPCMASRGFTVTEVPTRSEFEFGLGSWHPYLALPDDLRLEMMDNPDFLLLCPPMPPGIPDPGYASYFE